MSVLLFNLIATVSRCQSCSRCIAASSCPSSAPHTSCKPRPLMFSAHTAACLPSVTLSRQRLNECHCILLLSLCLCHRANLALPNFTELIDNSDATVMDAWAPLDVFAEICVDGRHTYFSSNVRFSESQAKARVKDVFTQRKLLLQLRVDVLKALHAAANAPEGLTSAISKIEALDQGCTSFITILKCTQSLQPRWLKRRATVECRIRSQFVVYFIFEYFSSPFI